MQSFLVSNLVYHFVQIQYHSSLSLAQLVIFHIQTKPSRIGALYSTYPQTIFHMHTLLSLFPSRTTLLLSLCLSQNSRNCTRIHSFQSQFLPEHGVSLL